MGAATCVRAKVAPTAAAALILVAPAVCASTSGSSVEAADYSARGEGWRLRIAGDSIEFRERVYSRTTVYRGVVPPRQRIPGGFRYEGELTTDYTVAGIVELETLPYVLTMTDRPCIGPRGRRFPTTVSFEFPPDRNPIAPGCGGLIPPQ